MGKAGWQLVVYNGYADSFESLELGRGMYFISKTKCDNAPLIPSILSPPLFKEIKIYLMFVVFTSACASQHD